jgi:type I restriction enzyme M protein
MADKSSPVDFHTFGRRLWDIANVFRDDTLKTTEYLEEFSYFLFLKLWDERERAEEQAAQDADEIYIPFLPDEYRFHHWAANPQQWAKERDYKHSLAFVQNMFNALARIGDVVVVDNATDAGALLRKADPDQPIASTENRWYIRCPSDQPEAHIFAASIDYRPERNLWRDLRLFRRIFSDHVLRVRYDPTIRELADRLMDLNLGEITSMGWDVLGRAYEFVVDKLGEQSQYGQYFTPRHIVKYMVKMVDPRRKEKIYDPASGTAGFLVEAYQQIEKKIDQDIPAGVRREQAHRELRRSTLYGVEKAPDVYKLGLMNMVLHGDGNANLDIGDSLSEGAQVDHKEKYDVVLTNPPLGPTAQDRVADFDYHVKQYGPLFLQHIMNALAPGGRVATIMKEGVLFSGQSVLVNLRRKLVDEFDVQAVISLPNGVFNPYSGAKTSILVFRRPKNETAPTTSRVWFYEVKGDGRDLGVTRRLIDDHDGDLPDMLDRWQGKKDKESDRSWWADVNEIRANYYNLTAARYAPFEHATVEYEDPNVLINQVVELETEILQGLKELLVMVR